MIAKEADEIVDGAAHGLNRFNIDELIDISSIQHDQCLHGVAKSSKLIIVITTTGKVARFVASHRPTVPVLAFCTDVQVARRLQLHRGILPMMLQSDLDPLAPTTKMGLLRAEAVS